MAYEERNVARQKVRRDSENDDLPLQYQLLVNGAKVTPTSATITVYRSGEDTAVLDATAMTVSGTLLTYALDTTETEDFPNGAYRADIVVTYSSVEYAKHIIFDVVPYVFDVNIGLDQLVALDDSIRGMQHDFDTTFAPLINSCNDILQMRIEAKLVRDQRLKQDMIIDHSALAICQRFYILHRIFFNKDNFAKSEGYKEDFESSLDAVLSTIKYDTALEGEEPAEEGGVDETRFET